MDGSNTVDAVSIFTKILREKNKKFIFLGVSLDKRQMCFGPVCRITPAVTVPERSITPAVTGSPARSIIPDFTGSTPIILWLHLPRISTACIYGV